ncbi:MAG: FHA domain-containing protein [Methylococcaceae bacterium]|nr:FHA domain-containing protein [Methylococcaceae bacterium]
MSQQKSKLAILFADICDSTALYERVGDALARHLTARCITTMRGQLKPFQGVLIKTIGDEIMCTFPNATYAFDAACAMQKAVRSLPAEHGISLHIRIGFHYGDVLCEAGDVFGDAVNVAARVASAARIDQIMTTLAVHDALPPALQDQTHQIMNAEFKGKQEKYPIFQITWEEDDEQSTRFNATLQRQTVTNAQELILQYGGQQYRINAEHNRVIIGRGDTCDIIVNNNLTSRQHARVEYRFGKFVLVDQSTNGTYLRSPEGQVIHLSRNEMILQGAGSFSLGQASFDHRHELINFSIVLA